MDYIFPWCSPLEAPEEPEWAYAVWKNGRKLWKIPIFFWDDMAYRWITNQEDRWIIMIKIIHGLLSDFFHFEVIPI